MGCTLPRHRWEGAVPLVWWTVLLGWRRNHHGNSRSGPRARCRQCFQRSAGWICRHYRPQPPTCRGWNQRSSRNQSRNQSSSRNRRRTMEMTAYSHIMWSCPRCRPWARQVLRSHHLAGAKENTAEGSVFCFCVLPPSAASWHRARPFRCSVRQSGRRSAPIPV